MAINKLKSLYYAFWLGWQIDSNWTDPFVFMVFTITKPLAAALTIFLMYYIIIGNFMSPLFGYVFVGSTFNAFLSLVLYSAIWMVYSDREAYQTLKYIYITETPIWLYYTGRLLVKFVAATISSIIILLAGIYIAKIPLNINPPLLTITIIAGIAVTLTLGYIFAFMAMLMARHSEGIASSLTALFFLISGVVFPIDILPQPVKTLSLIFPATYWFALLRRSVLGYDLGELGKLTIQQLWVNLILLTAIYLFIAFIMYKSIDYLVRKKGIIDMTTNY